MPRRLLRAAAAGALLLGLAACNGPGGGAATTPPPEIDISAPSDGGGESPSDGGGDPSDGGGENTDDPTAAAPDIPPPDPADFAGMDEQTPEGAEQAFRYYIAVSMWAHQTGDNSTLANLQSADCESCTEFMQTFTELQENNALWGEFSLTESRSQIHKSSSFDFEISYDFKTTSHERPSDDFSETVDVGELEYSTVGGMSWQDEVWTVRAISAEWGADVLSS